MFSLVLVGACLFPQGDLARSYFQGLVGGGVDDGGGVGVLGGFREVALVSRPRVHHRRLHILIILHLRAAVVGRGHDARRLLRQLGQLLLAQVGSRALDGVVEEALLVRSLLGIAGGLPDLPLPLQLLNQDPGGVRNRSRLRHLPLLGQIFKLIPDAVHLLTLLPLHQLELVVPQLFIFLLLLFVLEPLLDGLPLFVLVFVLGVARDRALGRRRVGAVLLALVENGLLLLDDAHLALLLGRVVQILVELFARGVAVVRRLLQVVGEVHLLQLFQNRRLDHLVVMVVGAAMDLLVGILDVQDLLVPRFLLTKAEVLLKGAVVELLDLFELVDDVLVGPPVFVEEQIVEALPVDPDIFAQDAFDFGRYFGFIIF